MSRDLNKWLGIGRLGKDPEIRYLPDGKACANFSIACSDSYKDKSGNKVEKTEWVSISAFGPLAEVIGNYLRKGSKVFIEGKFTTRKWQDKEGKDCYKTEIVASEMQMLDGKAGQGGDDAKSSALAASAQGGFEDFDDDIPF